MRPMKLFLGLLIGLFVLSLATPGTSQEDIVKARKNLMRSNERTRKALKKAAKDKDYTVIIEGTQTILANMEKLPSLLPKGSTAKDSRATKAIWEDWDGVQDHIGWVKTAATALNKAAMAKDAEMVSLEYESVNSACSQCHRDYRKRSRRKGKRRRR